MFLRLEDSPVTLLTNVKIIRDPHFLPEISRALIESARHATNERGGFDVYGGLGDLSVVIRYSMTWHYFHFMEVLILLFSVHREYYPNAVVRKLYIGRVAWPELNSQILQAIFPDVEVVFIIDGNGIEAERVIYIDSDDARSPINKFIDPLLMLARKWGPQLRSEFYSSIGIDDVFRPTSNKARPQCMYCKRVYPRTFPPQIEAKILALISRTFDVTAADFTGVPLSEQIRQSAGVNLMFGIHGNGLTNLLWLHSDATIIEIFPPKVHHYDYQMMAEVMGINYVGIADEAIYRPFSRFGEAYGHAGEVNTLVEYFPKSELLLALDLASEASANTNLEFPIA